MRLHWSTTKQNGIVLLIVVLLITIATVTLSMRGQANTNGLVASYNFNASSGTTLTDISGTGNNGTLSGATWSSNGKSGGALSFDGQNDYVQIADSNSLDLTSGMTLEAWVRPTTASGWRTVLFKHQPTHMTYALYSSTNENKPTGQAWIGGERDTRGTASVPNMQANTWTHLTSTYDGANMRLYVNGNLVATKPQTGAITTSNNVLWLGGTSIWSEWFSGLIDDVRIYNRALSAAEIQNDMNTSVAPPVTDNENPTAPSNLTQTAATESSVTMNWSASTDNVAVAGYGLFRNNTSAGTAQATSATLSNLSCGTTYTIQVDAYDAAGNRSGKASADATTSACDTTAPTVQITTPASGTSVTGAVNVAATASDNKSVTGVQFKLDGANLGSEDTAAPYSISWDTTNHSSGAHQLTAVARDGSGNQATSEIINVTVNNTTPKFVNDQLLIGLNEPTDMVFGPNGTMYVAERDGTIWSAAPNATTVNPTPFLQLSSVSVDNERGLLGIELDPNFASNGFIYTFYTHSDLYNRVSRFQATGGIALPITETIVWKNTTRSDIWHQGGDLQFGPDGYLYISVGDHLQAASAQSLSSFNGKILRIAKDGTVPTDNPFYDGSGPNADAIWLRGLRNAFRFTIDHQTNRMFIGDVGQGNWEEVNLGVKGANYGWPTCEGNCSTSGMTNPLYTYSHSDGDASVTSGFVYRGTQFPAEYQGNYFFGDYAKNWIKRLTFDANGTYTGVQNFVPADGSRDGPYGDIVGFAQGPDGSLYYVDAGPFATNNAGSVRRIKNVNANQPPTAQISANTTNGPAPLTVNFSSAGSADPEGQPITYSWNFGDGNSSTAASPSHTFTQNGRYTVRLTTSDGTHSTSSVPITITVGSSPSATILTPSSGSTFRAGETISFSGSATDPDDGPLSSSSLSWKIVFHHDSHIHPVMEATPGASGTFTIPTTGHTFKGNTSYEVVLTATDSDGIQTSTSTTIYPEKTTINIDTVPSGLTVSFGGLNYTTPVSYEEIVGFEASLETTSPQLNQATGERFSFASWSDGGAQSHAITVPAGDQTYTASFTLDSAAPVGLVAAYNFDEGNGNTLYDYSGSNNNGTLNGPIWNAGKNTGALLFDGQNDYVQVADSNSLDLTTGMTLEAWVRPTIATGWRTILFKHQPTHMVYSLYSSTNESKPTGQAWIGTERDTRGTASVPNMQANTWTHLASTYDGANMRLYVNGNLVATKPQTGSITTSNNVLWIGGTSIWNEWYSGLIDDVRIYNRALSAPEIQSDMNIPVGS